MKFLLEMGLDQSTADQRLIEDYIPIEAIADQAGSIQVTVEAEKLDGFDPMWLRNGVLEPLDEADVAVEG